MSSKLHEDPIPLTESFCYENETHGYDIKWVMLGDLRSPPLVFIHGTPWSSCVWKSYALALSRQYKVYLFDNPGFGESPLEQELQVKIFKPEDEVQRLDSDLSRQSEVFTALYKTWQAGWGDLKAHVIAHDHGGLMVLRAFLLHDCKYESLCLIDVVAIGPFGQALFKSVVESPEYSANLPDMAFEGILESYIRNAAFKELSDSTMKMLKAPWLEKGGKDGFIRQLCQANYRSTTAVEGDYRRVGREMPVKIIWGSEDKWIPVETAQRLGNALQAREIVTINEAGHLIMYDQPGQLGVELGVWLTSCQKKTALGRHEE